MVALLRKPDAIKVDVPVKYVGFDIPNEFVVGYGLDYAERYREMPYIGVLAPVGLLPRLIRPGASTRSDRWPVASPCHVARTIC